MLTLISYLISNHIHDLNPNLYIVGADIVQSIHALTSDTAVTLGVNIATTSHLDLDILALTPIFASIPVDTTSVSSVLSHLLAVNTTCHHIYYTTALIRITQLLSSHHWHVECRCSIHNYIQNYHLSIMIHIVIIS
jgi:hypothetical protein